MAKDSSEQVSVEEFVYLLDEHFRSFNPRVNLFVTDYYNFIDSILYDHACVICISVRVSVWGRSMYSLFILY